MAKAAYIGVYQDEIINTHGLPDAYTELEYIESTGTQFLNTKYRVKPTTEIDILLEVTGYDTANDWNGLFGARTAINNSDCFAGFVNKSTYILAFNYGGADYAVNGTAVSGERNITNKGKTFYQNGSALYTFSGNLSNGNYDFYLCAANLAGQARFSKQKLKYCRLYENGAIVHEYIPAKRKSDNVLGVYDVVSNTFITNAGTGTFIAGAEVNDKPAGSFARKIKKMYVGVDGAARKVKKGLIGAGGVARKFFDTFSIGYIPATSTGYTSTAVISDTEAHVTVKKSGSYDGGARLYFPVNSGDVITVNFSQYRSVGNYYADLYWGLAADPKKVPANYEVFTTSTKTLNKTVTATANDKVFLFITNIAASANNGNYVLIINSIVINNEQVFPS